MLANNDINQNGLARNYKWQRESVYKIKFG